MNFVVIDVSRYIYPTRNCGKVFLLTRLYDFFKEAQIRYSDKGEMKWLEVGEIFVTKSFITCTLRQV
jgi:hypothetical protein